jgi:orotidine-5'-phosphate decarboxylase
MPSILSIRSCLPNTKRAKEYRTLVPGIGLSFLGQEDQQGRVAR